MLLRITSPLEETHNPSTCELVLKLLAYLFEGLQQVAARDRQGDVYVVHNEERLLLALVWEAGEVVRYKQQHVYFRLLQKERTKGESISTWHKLTLQ